MKKQCILLRHGKTQGNIDKCYIGMKSDEPLCEIGIREIGLHKNKILSHINGNIRVFSSPLMRAVKTAEMIFQDMDITVIEDLAEIDFGIFEGKNHKMLDGDPFYQKWLDSGGTLDIERAEKKSDFIERSMRGFMNALESTRENEVTIIVCHGGNIMSVMSSLTGGNYYDYMVKNLEGYELSIEYNNERISDFTYNRISL